MPVGLKAIFKRPVPKIKKTYNAEALGACFEDLDRIAAEIGVTCIADMHKDYAICDGPPWFDAQKGMITMGAFVSYLYQHPDSVPDQETVLKDILALKEALSAANVNDIPFHFVLT